MVTDSPQLERVTRHLTRLQLVATRDRLDTLLQQAAREDTSYLDFLDRVLGEEVAAKNVKRTKMGIQIAHFPLQRRLEDFDFTLQPSIDRRLIHELETGRYLAAGENVLLLGPPGVGKTHLAIGLGRKAIEQGASCLAADDGLVAQPAGGKRRRWRNGWLHSWQTFDHRRQAACRSNGRPPSSSGDQPTLREGQPEVDQQPAGRQLGRDLR
jgi:hypothetical protein